MQDKRTTTEFYHRAKEVRRIAKGIFDKAEREVLLNFVADAERLAAKDAKKPT